MTISFGQKDQVEFIDENELYCFIGYLTKTCVVVQWENNQESGAWGNEGRMAFTTDDVKKHFPRLGYSAGVGNYVYRLNCNDFVKVLFDLGFVQGNTQDINLIRNKIHSGYQAAFDKGRHL